MMDDRESPRPETPCLDGLPAPDPEIESILTALDGAAAMVDRNLRCRYLSDRWKAATAMPAGALPGQLLAEAVPVLGPWLSEQARTVIDSGHALPSLSVPLTGHGPLEPTRFSSAGFFPVTQGTGEAAFVVIVLRDRSLAAGAPNDPHWGLFLGTLVHEFRNLLSPVLTSAQLLRRKGRERPDLVDSMTSGIERQARRLVARLDQLADFSRLARGKLALDVATVDLAEPLGQAVECARPQIERHGQNLVVAAPESGLRVLVDGERLAQAFDRILAYAVRYTPAGGDIRVGVGSDETGANIRIVCEGSGPDMPDCTLLFEAFQPRETARQGGAADLGIDLPLAKGLLELQGGTIDARRSREGLGIEFRIRLPIAPATPPDRDESDVSSAR